MNTSLSTTDDSVDISYYSGIMIYMRICTKCNNEKDDTEISLNNYWCKECQAHRARERRAGINASAIIPEDVLNYDTQEGQTRESKLLAGVKYRAIINNIPFNLTIEDCIIPTNCPVLGIRLTTNIHSSNFNSPSIDRLVPELGYIKGNTNIISHRANILKHDYNINQLVTELDISLSRSVDLHNIIKWMSNKETT